MRNGDDGIGDPGGNSEERPIDDEASCRVTPGKQLEAHVVNRHDTCGPCAKWQHPVGEVRDVGAQLLEDVCRQQLHPRNANRKVTNDHARARAAAAASRSRSADWK